ncbi:MAG TPA: chemotaxis response regulator protein-glutamate methylesterase [Chloroflexota bacterium]|nr:chemotaxis response regulator protein-glutamate methylesterase [Chloroflexota bacterium]
MPIRVLVVDDSAFMRRIISEAITAEPDMEVAGQAINGLDALLKVEQTQPDVVTLDVEMPEMDGLAALRHLMARYPRPVIMLSSLTQAGAVTTIRALTIGAVDFVAKPSGSISLDFHRVRDELIQKIRTAARARIHAPIVRPAAVAPPEPAAAAAPCVPSPRRPAASHGTAAFDSLVAIGTSTGGPRALSTVVPGLVDDGRTAYLIVQHMPAGFTRSLAERLDSTSSLHVREAEQGDHLVAGTVLVAPGDFHLQLSAHGTVQLFQGPRVHGVRPSVDVMLESVAQHYGARVVCAILTGMGVDGADGAIAVRAKGGFVIAEDEATCVVWGMPRAVAERGAANRIVPLENVSTAIAEAVASRLSHHTTLQLA